MRILFIILTLTLASTTASPQEVDTSGVDLFYRDDAMVDPVSFFLAYQEAARSSGGVLFTFAPDAVQTLRRLGQLSVSIGNTVQLPGVCP